MGACEGRRGAEPGGGWRSPTRVKAVKKASKGAATDAMRAYLVSTRVKAPKNDAAAIIEPVAIGDWDQKDIKLRNTR